MSNFEGSFSSIFWAAKPSMDGPSPSTDSGRPEELYTQLHHRVEWIMDDEASKRARVLGAQITSLRASINSLFSGDQYARHSHAVAMRESTMKLTGRLGKRTRQ